MLSKRKQVQQMDQYANEIESAVQIAQSAIARSIEASLPVSLSRMYQLSRHHFGR